jgi:hypothetical protein
MQRPERQSRQSRAIVNLTTWDRHSRYVTYLMARKESGWAVLVHEAAMQDGSLHQPEPVTRLLSRALNF